MDKKEMLLVDSYAAPFVQLVIEKNQSQLVFPIM
ncbi:F0F1 ATP synthase subunit delta, partial [Streptococcus danieliae]|nr:F0F1 ATP synthase subunit delta [Streptococcus danieliae]